MRALFTKTLAAPHALSGQRVSAGVRGAHRRASAPARRAPVFATTPRSGRPLDAPRPPPPRPVRTGGRHTRVTDETHQSMCVTCEQRRAWGTAPRGSPGVAREACPAVCAQSRRPGDGKGTRGGVTLPGAIVAVRSSARDGGQSACAARAPRCPGCLLSSPPPTHAGEGAEGAPGLPYSLTL